MIKFRTINGSDNHPNDLGEVESELLRLLKPAYEDGFNLPRGIIESQPNNLFIGPSRLPNPREISNAVSAQTKSIPNFLNASDWIWQWGQFLDHDLDLNEGGGEAFFIPVDPNDPLAPDLPQLSAQAGSRTRQAAIVEGNTQTFISLPFLGNTASEAVQLNELLSETENTENINFTHSPGFLNQTTTGIPFIPLTRIPAAPGTGTEPGNPRQHINDITSFIDGSQVYGSDEERAEFLRANDGTGKLKSQIVNGEVLLPFNERVDGEFLPNANPNPEELPPEDLFIAGDVRANEQIGLTAAHTLFLREHNSVAEEIGQRIEAGDSEILKLWQESGLEKGDFIYESARKVVGAQIQVITYNDYLPLLIGKNLLEDYSGYNPAVDPRISQEFANVSFRLGHSQLSPELQRVNADGTSAGSISLGDAFFEPQEVINNGVDSLIFGLTSQEAQEVDNLVVDGVRNFLFPAGTGGFDLAAVNIQRGRDVGLPSYNDARVGLGLEPVTTFLTTDRDMGITSDPEVAARFASIYDSVNDVDFWIGGISEDPVNGGLVGELFNQVLTNQFARLRDGDRFFYLNHLDDLLVLDPDLQTTTLSDIILRNTLGDYVIQNNAFVVPSLSVDTFSSKEGRQIEFVASLSDVSSAVVTLDFETIDGTATAGVDYVDTSGTLVFNPGETSKSITVNVLNDSVFKDNETVLFRISNASNQNIEDGLAVSRQTFTREISGSSSDEILTSAFGNSLIQGFEGNDRIFGGFGNNFLDGGLGNDRLNATSGNDTQRGGDGNDTLNGGLGKDTQFGDDGDDTLNGDFNFGNNIQFNTNNFFNSSNFNSSRFSFSLFSSDDIQFGGDGNDTLNGGFGPTFRTPTVTIGNY
jgi:hypothetical protein